MSYVKNDKPQFEKLEDALEELKVMRYEFNQLLVIAQDSKTKNEVVAKDCLLILENIDRLKIVLVKMKWIDLEKNIKTKFDIR